MRIIYIILEEKLMYLIGILMDFINFFMKFVKK